MADQTPEREMLLSSITGTSSPMVAVAAEVLRERVRQDVKWGEQNHPNGTGEDWNWLNGQGSGHIQRLADEKREDCERHFSNGTGSYADVLTEEFYEALAEDDQARLRAELIQVAAVAVAWVEKIDRDARRPDPICSERGVPQSECPPHCPHDYRTAEEAGRG